jgi:HK97 family phage portal protein
MSDYEIIRPKSKATGLARFGQALRSITLGPWNPRDRQIARYFGGAPTNAGVSVNEQTAMNYSAVWAAVNLIAGDVAKVPLVLFKELENGGKQRFESHHVYRLIHDRPNPQMASAVFRRTLQAHKMIWGNGYAEIERDVSGRPIALWPLMPYAVQPYVETGVLRYRVFNPSTPPVELAASDMIHIRGLGGDGTCGQSVIPCARESLGLGIAAERFGATFFGNGSTFGGVIRYPVGIGGNPQTRKENREAIEKVHTGVDRAHRFLALYEGAEYQQLGVPPNAAQFLETREFQIEEVCRWFNVPPHKIRHLKNATFSNIESQSIEYVGDTLEPHWVDWEQELEIKLIPPLERNQQTIEHVRQGLLRGDSAGRGEFYSKLFSIGAITINEIRDFEGLNPVDGGNTAFVPLNALPLDRIGEYYDAIIEEKTAPPPPQKPDPNAPPPPNQQQMDEMKAAWDVALQEARQRAQRAEDATDVATAALATAESDRDRAVANGQAAIDARDVEIVALRGAVADANAALTTANGIVAELTSEREELITQANESKASEKFARLYESDAWHAAVMLSQECDVLAARRDELTASLADAHAETAEATTAMAAATRDEMAADAERDTATARADATIAEAAASIAAAVSESDTLKTELAQARSEIATELDRARNQKATLLAAMRSLFVDASERLLQKEADRARKQQGSPAKLKAWIDSFYPLHKESCRSAFRPLVGPWTAITGGAPGLLLDRLVAEHVDASRSALSLAADVDDGDELAANLERVLGRWESERAEAMADALVHEGMAGHG